MDQDLSPEISEVLTKFTEEIQKVDNFSALQELRVKYLGKKGIVTGFFRNMGKLSPEERPIYGQQINFLKEKLEKQTEDLEKQLTYRKLEKQIARDKIDVTLPGKRPYQGSLHPITRAYNEMISIFERMGFLVAQGPEIESDFYNFEALNFPSDHPAREMQDTFYLPGGKLLRTHTSPVQVHVMEEYQPPIAIIAPGKVYRCDADVTHSPMFFQIEGLLVDQNVSFSDLKGSLKYFLSEFFHEDIKLRLRPSFFPFTEPSAEVDIQCVFCHQKGCNICKQSGWLEVLGCGMVDPNVFKAVDIDPEKYSGYAFGLGVDRFAMLKYGINNIRLFYENRFDFLEHF